MFWKIHSISTYTQTIYQLKQIAAYETLNKGSNDRYEYIYPK